MSRTHVAVHRAKVRGSLLGLACGDSLGAAFAGVAGPGAAQVDAWESSPESMTFTSNTAMASALAEHLAETVAVGLPPDDDELVAAFLREWKQTRHGAVGRGAESFFVQVLAGAPWRAIRCALFGGTGSMGNAAAVRATPVGLLPLALPDIAGLARGTAATTHVHRLGQEGAVVHACAVAVAAASDPAERLDVRSFFDTLTAQVTEPAMTAQLVRVAALPDTPDPALIARCLGYNSTALGSVPAGLAAFLAYPDQPRRAVSCAIRIGGDAPTTAAMTGALVGARCGDRALPASWLRRLTVGRRLAQLADRLAAAQPQRTTAPSPGPQDDARSNGVHDRSGV